MDESLMQRHRVKDEGRKIVNFLICRKAEDEAPANYVPAAAVKRRGRALSGFTGLKEYVGVSGSLGLKPAAQPRNVSRYFRN